MKKASKIYLWAWAAFVAAAIVAVVVVLVVPSHHDLARDPYAIERIVKVDLPEIVRAEYRDNLDRESSRWDVYVHRGRFIESLSVESIEIMETLCLADSVHWSKNESEGCYVYNDEGGIDELYSVSCSIYADRFVTSYFVDESEGIFGYLLILLIGAVLLIWRLGIATHKRNE